MSDPSLNLSPIIDSMQAPIQRYAERIRDLGGTNALTLVVFGSLAAGSFDPSRHTARSVLILQSVDLDMLRQLAKDGAKLGKARIAAPLIMTPEYIEASVDVFPLRVIELKMANNMKSGNKIPDSQPRELRDSPGRCRTFGMPVS